MPYIKPHRRPEILQFPAGNVGQSIENAGDLNFLISHICGDYLHKQGLKYANINEIIGALECAKLEMYRRVAAPYEDFKIAENGDVYPEGTIFEDPR